LNILVFFQAAQEKEELQRSGDELDVKIRKAEKEMNALENTLRVINVCNTSYKKSFSKVTETSEEYEEIIQVEEQERAAEEKNRYKRRQIRELQEDMQVMKNTLESILKEEMSFQQNANELLPAVTQLNKETEDQNHKLERVMRQFSKIVKEIRQIKKTKEETHFEQDVNVRDLRDFNKSINKMLTIAMEKNSDLVGAIQLYFHQFGLDVPKNSSTPGSYSSRSSSSHSSTLSVRYVAISLVLNVSSVYG
ncbi:hypothetical protein GDO86_003957, partial [Hymenochirus boettgeri]